MPSDFGDLCKCQASGIRHQIVYAFAWATLILLFTNNMYCLQDGFVCVCVCEHCLRPTIQHNLLNIGVCLLGGMFGLCDLIKIARTSADT